jgi:uncharacterized protein YqfB (UPF0267 family)
MGTGKAVGLARIENKLSYCNVRLDRVEAVAHDTQSKFHDLRADFNELKSELREHFPAVR